MLEVKAKIGKRRTLVIPKKLAEKAGIREGVKVKLRLTDDGIIIIPIPNAIELSLQGNKIAKITLEELEAESVEQQKRIPGLKNR
ncbi:MAG: AbrB/MazE/SpoVT family DNA-binding domain-containing protein [Candidatus Njordarchaeia archaeon]